MKKHLLLFLLWLPMAIYAQVDKKYLEGAVPVVDGKVTFSQETECQRTHQGPVIHLAAGLGEQVFQTQRKYDPTCVIHE